MVVAAGMALAGCMVGPDYVRPDLMPQTSWGEPAEAPARPGPLGKAAAEQSRTQSVPGALVHWWTTLSDPELDSLVERAVQSNLDLQRAQARVRQARADRKIVTAGLFPEIDSGSTYTRSRDSSNALLALNGVPQGDQNLYQFGFDATWELDVFGGNRRAVEAATADEQASVDDLRDALVTLLAEVARAYVDYRGAQQQIAIARVNVDAQRSTLQLTQRRYDAGLTSELDVVRARSQVATTEAQIPTLQTQARVAVHEIGVLLGQAPSALSSELETSAPIPAGPSSVPLGLPSELLRRRPDLRRAERQLAAATARIGVATRDLYPRFFLFGAAGIESFKASDWWTWGSRYYSAGPSLSWPIFSGGRIQGNIALQDAKQEEQLLTYHEAILIALQEVEDSIVAFTEEQDRRTSLAESVTANSRATDLARVLYTQGLTDFLSVLDAERSLYQSQDALSQSERAVTNDLIVLYKALGGGWEPEPEGEGGEQLASAANDGAAARSAAP
jgi:NodT family efflux transporter outer membrane factor (OMF) lipoprotein